VRGHRLGDHPGRVGEVDHPGARRVLGDRLGQAHHHRDRAQREADAARAGRLLSKDAQPERHVLVDHTAFELPDADRAEDVVRVLDGVDEISGGTERQLVAVLFREPFEHVADALKPRRVDVVQDDLGEAEPLGPLEQGAVDERDAEAPAADDGELHAIVTSMDAAARVARLAWGIGWSVTM